MTLQEFITRLDSVRDPEGIFALVVSHARTQGFSVVSYHHFDMATYGANRETTIRTSGFPKDWIRNHSDKGLTPVDLVPLQSVLSSKPFFWGDEAEQPDQPAQNEIYMKELRTSGLGDGIAVRVFGPVLSNVYFGLGFGGPRTPYSQLQIRLVQAALQAAHVAYCLALPSAIKTSVKLSKREQQVMQLVASGASNGAVAAALCISRSTVDTLMKRVFAKLEVTDRTTAAIRAISVGLIQMP